ncbi:MAG: hypothetical protein IPJ30_16990 [Acidobacteria bacterium]|nr:hypothetical protein [Acidobacteriota bacterium]
MVVLHGSRRDVVGTAFRIRTRILQTADRPRQILDGSVADPRQSHLFRAFCLTDVDGEKFQYAHRKSSNGWFDYPASASEDHFHLRLGDWSLRESHGTQILRATVGDLVFEADLKPLKAPILNGRNKDGVSCKDEGEASRYFAYHADGNGRRYRPRRASRAFQGFGDGSRVRTWTPTENQKGWDWFSIQLENNTELMCYQLATARIRSRRLKRDVHRRRWQVHAAHARGFLDRADGLLEIPRIGRDLPKRLAGQMRPIRTQPAGDAVSSRTGTRHARNDDDHLLGRRLRSRRRRRRTRIC